MRGVLNLRVKKTGILFVFRKTPLRVLRFFCKAYPDRKSAAVGQIASPGNLLAAGCRTLAMTVVCLVHICGFHSFFIIHC
jgi:hypothetical protein